MHQPVSRAASPAALRARSRARLLLAKTCVTIAALTLAACFDRTTAPPPSLTPVPRHDFLGDANWGANNSAASGSYDGTIDLVYGGAPHAAQALGPFVYPTFITANVSGQVRQVPGAVQGQNIVREAWSTNDPYFWGSMGFHSNGGVWWPIGPSAILRVVAPIAPFRNDAGGQPTGDWSHCGWAGYALCWSWAGAAHFDFQRIHVDLTLARSPDTTVWQGTSATFTAGMGQTNFPGNPYPVDMSALQWRWISDSLPSDSVACQSTSGRTCTHVFTSSGTMYTAAYVNGEAQQKTIHVQLKVPKLEVTATNRVLATPGDTDTFVAQGNGVTVVTGWAFSPDSSPSASASTGSVWGNCAPNVSNCTNFVSQSGTVSVTGTVNGVQLSAKVHVTVIPCPTKDSLLDTKELRDELGLMFDKSHPSNPLQRRENAFWMYQDTLSGAFSFVWYVSPSTGCSIEPVNPNDSSRLPANSRVVAGGHGHPYAAGETVPAGVCPKYPNGGMGTAGPSPGDKNVADQTGVPQYIVDADEIYRTSGTNSKTESWMRKSAACADLLPPKPTANLIPLYAPLLH
jgi:hypothetical protein